MHMGMREKKGFMAVKLDMCKAYDRVEWVFLKAVMKRMGFGARWIALVMMCVKTMKYSIIVNGNPYGMITPSQGIRQVDPISPYLFFLCAEALSALITTVNADGRLTGVPTSTHGPEISHLFFADDSLLFCRANLIQWNHLSSILQLYKEASGQKMNANKTAIFYSRNTPVADKEYIQGVAGIPINQRYDTYLGLPDLVGRLRTSAFKSITKRVWKRLQDWKIKFLSQAGKEILLKAVIQAIPTYCISVFMLLKALCTEINSMMAKFFWGHKEKDKRIHWMSWNKLCFSMAKGDCSILEASLGKKPSFARRSIHNSSDLVREGLVWRVGNGKTICIWKDIWINSPTTYQVQTAPRILADTSMVVDGMLKKCGSEDFAQFVSISWCIRLRWNEVIHNEIFLHPNQLIKQVGLVGENFHLILAGRRTQQVPTGEPPLISWIAMPHGCLKANWDAGFNRRKGRMGLKAVI
ncbi:uncharacterized protein LOC132178220 [Corylus avellana]|uniref:uncharacterized protein LOC132178220 n=1 Tax=Corylus avellana TaxID=13451 RepID=UPI00286C3B0A|nr:uncharacterized protein LOC132178220 [Corylus avellana]